MHNPPPPPQIAPALQAFRGDQKTELKLHSQEQALLVIAAAHLCFMPWALGTMHVWSQLISLVLAAAGFTLALVNRHYTDDYAPEGNFRLIMWPKLVRFPIFWLGLALLGYIAIQALNPAWIYAANGGYLWVVPLEHVSWLPSGVEAPFAKMNAWRTLMIYGSSWLLVCALWVGITRRAAVQRLLTIVVVNGAVLAIIGILQRGTHAKYILWGLKDATTAGSFFATIIYKNHAGAYFNLVLMISVALTYWHFARGERRMQRSNPSPFFAFCAVLLGIGVILTNSRAATLLLMGFSFVAFLVFVIRSKSSNGADGRNTLTFAALCGIFIVFIGLGALQLKLGPSIDRVSKLIQAGETDGSVNARRVAREAAWDMAKEHLATGWGAGSFRHIFPAYQRNYPDIYYSSPRHNRILFWEYAHNDYMQLLDELGLVGAGLFLAMAACALVSLARNRFYRRNHLVFIALALVVLLSHGWMDFPSHNPAILLLGCATAALACRWCELEYRRT